MANHQPYKAVKREYRLNTATLGRVGENIVANLLMMNRYLVYRSENDIKGIDMVVQSPTRKNRFITIQVKYHTVHYETTYGKSLKVNITPTYANYIAVPIDRGFFDDKAHVLFYKAEKECINKRYVREFGYKKPYTRLLSQTRNQHKTKWAKDYYRLPK
jgi:hypothetical protein